MSDDDSDEEERKRVEKVNEVEHLGNTLLEQFEPFLTDQRLDTVYNGADHTDEDEITLASLKGILGFLRRPLFPRSTVEAENRLEDLKLYEPTLVTTKTYFDQYLARVKTEQKYEVPTIEATVKLDSSSEEEDDNNCIAWRIPRRILEPESRSRAPMTEREASRGTHRPLTPLLQPHSSGHMPIIANPSVPPVGLHWPHIQPIVLIIQNPSLGQFEPIFNAPTAVPQSPFPQSPFPPDFSQPPPIIPRQPHGNSNQRQQPPNRIIDTGNYGGVKSSSPAGVRPSPDVWLGNAARKKRPYERRDPIQHFVPQPSTSARTYREHRRQNPRPNNASDPTNLGNRPEKRKRPNEKPKEPSLPKNAESKKPQSSDKDPPRHPPADAVQPAAQSNDLELILPEATQATQSTKENPSEDLQREADAILVPIEDLQRELDAILAQIPEANQIRQPSSNQYIAPPELDSAPSEEAAMPQNPAISEEQTPTKSKAPSARASPVPSLSHADDISAVDTPAVNEPQCEPQRDTIEAAISTEILEQPPAATSAALPPLIPPENIKKEKIEEPEEDAVSENSKVDPVAIKMEVIKNEAHDYETDSNQESADDTDSNSEDEDGGPVPNVVKNKSASAPDSPPAAEVIASSPVVPFNGIQLRIKVEVDPAVEEKEDAEQIEIRRRNIEDLLQLPADSESSTASNNQVNLPRVQTHLNVMPSSPTNDGSNESPSQNDGFQQQVEDANEGEEESSDEEIKIISYYPTVNYQPSSQ